MISLRKHVVPLRPIHKTGLVVLTLLLMLGARSNAQSSGDFDASGRSGIAVWDFSTGTYYVWPAVAPAFNYQFAPNPSFVPLTADFDGDGKADLAVWWPSPIAGGSVLEYIASGSGNELSFPIGQPGDIPLVGDFDGSGKSGIGIWRPSNGTFYVYPAVGATFTRQLGQAGDVPLAGDYDGDHIADLTVWRPSTGSFYFVYSSTGQPGSFSVGQAGDIPLVADFDGSGKTGVAVWRPSNATFYAYPAVGPITTFQLGQTGDIPLASDFDGDGKADFAVWRPSNGVLYFVNSSNGQQQSYQAGRQGDIPMPSEPASLMTSGGTFTISGHVLSGTSGVPNVGVALTGTGMQAMTTRTASDGSFTFSAPAGASVLVQANDGPCTPASVSFSNLSANQTVTFQGAPNGLIKEFVYLGGQVVAVTH